MSREHVVTETEPMGGFFARCGCFTPHDDVPPPGQLGHWWVLTVEGGEPTNRDGTYATFATRAGAEAHVAGIAAEALQ